MISQSIGPYPSLVINPRSLPDCFSLGGACRLGMWVDTYSLYGLDMYVPSTCLSNSKLWEKTICLETFYVLVTLWPGFHTGALGFPPPPPPPPTEKIDGNIMNVDVHYRNIKHP